VTAGTIQSPPRADASSSGAYASGDVETPRLTLPLLSPELLDALALGDSERSKALAPFQLPSGFGASERELFALRRDQARDPAWRPWLLRAIVLREQALMVGYINFHGPPGVNDTGSPDALGLGYAIFPSFRGRGFATEAASALLDSARLDFGVTQFIAGISPDNAASIRVVEKLGFSRTPHVVEGEAIFELRLDPPPRRFA
jgi:ribosomal-protein-alanine N-acetyltransferase